MGTISHLEQVHAQGQRELGNLGGQIRELRAQLEQAARAAQEESARSERLRGENRLKQELLAQQQQADSQRTEAERAALLQRIAELERARQDERDAQERGRLALLAEGEEAAIRMREEREKSERLEVLAEQMRLQRLEAEAVFLERIQQLERDRAHILAAKAEQDAEVQALMAGAGTDGDAAGLDTSGGLGGGASWHDFASPGSPGAFGTPPFFDAGSPPSPPGQSRHGSAAGDGSGALVLDRASAVVPQLKQQTDRLVVLVDEANALCELLDEPCRFRTELLTGLSGGSSSSSSRNSSGGGSSGGSSGASLSALMSRMDKVQVQVAIFMAAAQGQDQGGQGGRKIGVTASQFFDELVLLRDRHSVQVSGRRRLAGLGKEWGGVVA